MSFSNDQLSAATAFAHTMIVVDDEPGALVEEVVPEAVQTPGRQHSTPTDEIAKTPVRPEAQRSHPLDAKALIDGALELGLVCAVVTPRLTDQGVTDRIAKAARRADIVSLDWHMNHGDEGELASEIIQAILVLDEDNGGRLRLIAIYTGNQDKEKILSLVSQRVNANGAISGKLERKGDALVNASGVRIVWREKAMGRTAPDTLVSESRLPSELLKEFSTLSAGLLTNVALSAISSMRDTTHHVLSKFKADLDGPFLHHRAFIQKPDDSMDYAVSIVLSALKAEVDKAQIAASFSSADAIKRRLETMEQYPDKFIFRFVDDKGAEKEATLHSTEVLQIITNGYATLAEPDKRQAFSADSAKRMTLITRKNAKKNFSSVFFSNTAGAKQALLDFAFLTNSRSSELSRVHRKSPPRLDLGSVLYCENIDTYLLCLQATCDTVRGSGAFFFVPLIQNDAAPDHIVPHGKLDGKIKFVCLSEPENGYTQSRSVSFGAIDPKIGRVSVPYDEKKLGYFVTDKEGVEYRWLGNLKYKRALRAAQRVGQEMSRVGFDEFEPFRKN
jgi:hypothetical protein